MTTRSPTSSSGRNSVLGLVTVLLLIFVTQVCSGAYYGKLIGKLSELHHGVSGEVYAVDGRTLFIKDFTYDGEGPAAFFYVGSSKSPNGNGHRVRDERGTTNVLKRYRRKDITLTLPDGKTLNNIKWFSVWCDEFSVNFGDVRIQRGFDYPKPQKLASLSGVHGVSSEPVVVVDAQTLLIPGFSYDGEAPDAKFWVGAGPSPSPEGIRVPDENGKEEPLRRYDHKTIVLTLPGDLTVHQLGHFGVWCEAFTVDFGHIQIPQSLNVPPSLKMLGVSPQSKLNCEVLEDNLAFEVRWAVAGDSIVVQLVGKLEAGQYMSFGVSANPERSIMVGGDLVVAWVDKETLQGYAVDYFLEAKAQCAGGRGSCPDDRILSNTASVRLLNAAMVNGYSIVTYQRPLKASDELDLPIYTNMSQAIIWAVGPLNERGETSFHSDYLKTDKFIEFGRPPAWNCPMPDPEQPQNNDNDDRGTSRQDLVATTRRPQRPATPPATPAPAPKTDAWYIPPIECYEPEDGVFFAQMGPTGGKHGYPAITGHVGWGISWYINGLLIPEINVVRGKKYSFYVEGGDDPDTPARYHPFYITDDPIGGYQHKTPEEKAKVKIFAGVRRSRGTVRPTGVGRLCNWIPDQDQPLADEFNSFGAYQRTLSLKCDAGEPGIVEWTPDENTPDTVYYQCFTHRYLGWKINVRDSCDTVAPSASETHEVYVAAELKSHDSPADLDSSPSIRVTSKVTPTSEYLQQHLHHSHHDHGLRHPHHSTTNPGKLSMPHTQLLTTSANNNNHYDRLHSSSSYEDPYGLRSAYSTSNHVSVSHHPEVRLKDYHLDEDTLSSQKSQTQQTAYYREPSTRSTVGLSAYATRPIELEESGQSVQASNHQLSNLVADSPRPMSHGVKYVYPPGAQVLYSRAPTHYASNHHYPHNPHHHHHQPEQRTQLMIVRRPVLMRRPMLQSASHSIGSSAMSLQPRPIFMERKKAVYRMPAPTLRMATDKVSFVGGGHGHQLAKLMKLDNKPRTKMEAKVSEAATMDVSETLMGPMKPARNTGFNPDSIVIEGGFKPIIRNVEPRSPPAQKRILEGISQEESMKEDEYRPAESFEPVFIPSPPVTADRNKKKKKIISLSRGTKTRLDDIDDMEMAADRIETYYLPPTTHTKIEDLPPTSGVLVTYDGKTLKDSNLAKSISRIEERGRGRLNSDALSRTPQFGRYKGDLPPSISDIPRDIREDSYDKRRSSVELPHSDLIPKQKTKLTLVTKVKRSTREGRPMSSTYFEGNNSTHGSINHHDHQDHHDHQGHQDHQGHGMSTLVSAGQTILANMEYIILTAVLYYVI